MSLRASCEREGEGIGVSNQPKFIGQFRIRQGLMAVTAFPLRSPWRESSRQSIRLRSFNHCHPVQETHTSDVQIEAAMKTPSKFQSVLSRLIVFANANVASRIVSETKPKNWRT